MRVSQQLTPNLMERRTEESAGSDQPEVFDAKEVLFISDLVTWIQIKPYPDPNNGLSPLKGIALFNNVPIKSQQSTQVMVTFSGDDKDHLFQLLEYGCTVNSMQYHGMLKRFEVAFKVKGRSKDLYTVHIHQDNAQPYTFLMTNQATGKLRWSMVPHSLQSWELAPLNFHLFSTMKDNLWGQWFQDKDR